MLPILILSSCLRAPYTDIGSRAIGHDARLTTLAYPYDVHTLPLRMQGRAVELVYMDVKPADPNGRTVVLLHGKHFSGSYWEPLMNELLSGGYRVVVPDQIGFGKSSKPIDVQYSLHTLARQTRDLLDALKIDRAAVVGHSMGGMLGVRLALDHPGRVDQLVLLNPIGLEDWQRMVPYRTVDEWAAAERTKTADDLRKYMKQSWFGDTWRPEYEALIEVPAGWIVGPDREQIVTVSALTSDMVFTQPVVYELKDLTVPTLLVIGQRDRTALGKDTVDPKLAKTLGNYPVLGQRAALLIPDAELVELEDVGHLPHVEAFDATVAAVVPFLAGGP